MVNAATAATVRASIDFATHDYLKPDGQA